MELISAALADGAVNVDKAHHSSTVNKVWRKLCGGYTGCAECSWSAEHDALNKLAISVFHQC